MFEVSLFSSFHSSFFYHAKIRISKNEPNNKTICRIETFASKCCMQKLSHCCYFVLVSVVCCTKLFCLFFARKRSIQQPKKNEKQKTTNTRVQQKVNAFGPFSSASPPHLSSAHIKFTLLLNCVNVFNFI